MTETAEQLEQGDPEQARWLDRDDIAVLALAGGTVGADVCLGLAFGWLPALAAFFVLLAVWGAATLGLLARL